MDNLLTEIQAFCKRHEMSKWDFGEKALNDRPFVGQLEKGRDIKFSTAARVRDWMDEQDRKAAA
ncbi:hypothetical protein [Aurantiacibacter spongiae]|uniref:XRE family transcriptional regulator n=1 Tax=Aurantiacibacter spongiae TaxID=2488860 RepID=A0A3N5CT00_9SPHN|nr:hypothetical protein [Aurantiacibacter spongiae]RPF70470.1 hypothetical protein EG799_01610 [Aurantiacibacter spongiae]